MLAVFVADIRDQQDLGMVRQQVFLDDMDFQLAEAPAERDLLFLGQMLVAEKDDDVVVEMPLQLGEGRIVDRPGQVEDDLGAARGAGFTDRDRASTRTAVGIAAQSTLFRLTHRIRYRRPGCYR